MVWVRWPKPSPLVSSLVILHPLIFTSSPNPSTLAALAPSNVQDNRTPTYQGSSALNDLGRDWPSSDWMMDHLASIDPHVQVHIIAPATSGDNSPLLSLPPLSSLPPTPDTPTYPPQFFDGSTERPLEPAPPIWHSVNTSPQHRPMIRPLGLRYKPTMDWGMRARARYQIHWDKYWFQVEASRYEGDMMMDQKHQARREQDTKASGQEHSAGESEDDNKSTAGDQDNGTKHSTSYSPPARSYSADVNSTDNSNNSNGADNTIPNGANGTLNTTKSFAGTRSGGCEGMSTEAPSISPTSKEDDKGCFYFHQILNHFQEPSSSPRGESEGRSGQETFRQYYHVSAEFYKPGKEQT